MDEPAHPIQPVPPLRAILLGAGRRPNVLPEARRLRPLIERHARIVAEDFTGELDMSGQAADLAIVLGGDGAILRAVHQMGRRQLPVVAVNLGKLGFLADLTPAELPDILSDFARGRLGLIEHLMFCCQVIRQGEERPSCQQLGLNEVVVWSGPTFAMMELDLYVDSELVTTYSCDGLILSTPVGSTAHSLSAGGPILRKELQAFVISPISPHTLTNRPVVDSAERVYELVVARPNAGTSVVVDGQVLRTLQPGDRVRVEKAEPRFRIVDAPGHGYYRTLREKLGWGGRLQLNDRTEPGS
jgi:NAD+ kinase